MPHGLRLVPMGKYVENYGVVHRLEVDGEDYIHGLLILTYLSVGEIRGDLENEYKSSKETGKVVIDTLFHMGLNSGRFLEIELHEGRIDWSTIQEVIGTKVETSGIKGKTGLVLERTPELMEMSVLNSIQKRMFEKGIRL